MSAGETRNPAASERVTWGLVALVAAWWWFDLQVHWKVLPEFQHGWMVGPLAAFLGWERFPQRPRSTPLRHGTAPLWLASGMAPLVLAAELHKHGVASTPASSFVLSVGCLGFVLAILWAREGGAYARHFLFPFLFLFVAVPIPKTLWNPIVLGLQGLITAANVEVLNLIGIPAQRTGNLIHLPRGTVGVDEACSGIRSLQSSIMATLFIADLTLRSRSLKIFLFVAGVSLAVVGNFGRAFFLSVTAQRQGIEAVERFHDQAGWTVLLFTAAGISLLAWRIHRAEQRIAREPRGRNPGGGSRASIP